MCSCANHIFALIDAKMILHIHLKGFLVHFINGVSDKACQNIASCTIVSTLSLILSEIVRILTGTCADLKDTHSKFQILLDIMDRSQKLDHTTLGSQMCIFIVCAVMAVTTGCGLFLEPAARIFSFVSPLFLLAAQLLILAGLYLLFLLMFGILRLPARARR